MPSAPSDTAKLVAELQALREKATEGPWRHVKDSFDPPEHFIAGPNSALVCGPDGPDESMNDDYEYIVALVNAAPRLFAMAKLAMEAHAALIAADALMLDGVKFNEILARAFAAKDMKPFDDWMKDIAAISSRASFHRQTIADWQQRYAAATEDKPNV
jgi:hypothetical protein